jgi:hypothetical protein
MNAALTAILCTAAGAGGFALTRLAPHSDPPAAAAQQSSAVPVPRATIAPLAPAPATHTAAEKFLAKLREAGNAGPGDCRRLFLLALEENDAVMTQAAAQSWAEQAPADFWRWMGSLSQRDFELRKPVVMTALQVLLREWVHQDADAAIAAVSAAAPALHLMPARGEVFQALLTTAPEKAFAMAARFTHMATAWGIDAAVWRDDPARFARAAATLPAGPVRDWIKDQALYEAAVHWHRRDPAAALTWMRTLNPAEQCFFLPKIIRDTASRDFAAARRLVESLPHSMPQEAAGVELAEQWGRTDPAAALAWAEEHLLSRRLPAVDGIMEHAVAADARRAAQAAENLPPGNARDRAVSRVAWRWSQQDADAAMDWVAALPADSARRAAFDAMGRDWVLRNPQKAAAWMQSVPAVEVPDFLVHPAARLLALQDADSALQWAAALPKEHRVTAMRGVVGQLVWTSPQPEFAPLLAKLEAPQQQLAVHSMVDNWAWTCEGPQPAWVRTLTPAQRATARQRIQNYTFLNTDDRGRLLEALE